MIGTNRKNLVASFLVCATLGLMAVTTKPVHAQALAGSVSASTSPTGYFHCVLNGVWTDTGWSWAEQVLIDNQIAYWHVTSSTLNGQVLESLDLNVGALSNNNAHDPTYVPLHGYHTCRLQLFTPAGSIYDSGNVGYTFP